ncbi:NAD-dependent epimerase/dehydratase family protein [Dysgonomonas termitidis]|uniref:NAD-dependent epimerase/dehydratase family protein n=1 Tax=Dysgonomonas termitidis TaxID=1516126 RepID=A0ABV9L0N8_9BACT
MSKIIITGGSGFIGTNLIDNFLKKGSAILSLDMFEPKKTEHIPFFRKIDICNYYELESAILDFTPDYVIHLAARTDLNGKTLEDYNANILGVENLIKVLKKVETLKRVIFTSSMYVCNPGYIPDGDNDYHSHTVYGESKVLTEKIIKESDPEYCWSIIRPTSIWGPYFGEPYNLFFNIVLSRKYFHMGDKACSKTYGYIDNTIYQIESILTANEEIVNKKVFYLGDYIPYNITEWANEIASEAGFKIPRIPYFLFKCGGLFGDFVKLFGVKFPMTSFRLKNMTTDNIHNLEPIREIAPNLPVERAEGVKRTIKWIKN